MTLPTLRYYQTDVVNRAGEVMKQGLRRVIIQGGTGAGKGHCIGYMAHRAYHKGSSVLILADRRKLISQLEGVLNDFGITPGIIMAGRTGGTKERVILACRDTLAGWLESDRDLPPADLVMPDECHLLLGARYQAIMDHYRKAHVVGFTATPARNDGKSLGNYFEKIVPMVLPSQLIREGYLIKPEVYAPIELAAKRKEGNAKGLAGDPVTHWRLHADGLPTIAFSSGVNESMGLRDRFIADGIPAEHIDATVPEAEREAMFRRLATGETLVLCSVKLLIQGVDIPEVSAAILWSPFNSIIEYLQSCGRIMRPAPGKTRAVVLDHSGAAGVHGLPGEDVEWSLELTSTVDERRNKAIEKGEKDATVFCHGCGYAFSGRPDCPNCGAFIPKPKPKRKTLAEQFRAGDGTLLSRIDDPENAGFVAKEKAERDAAKHKKFWERALFVAKAKEGTMGMACAIFRSISKKAPRDAGIDLAGVDFKMKAAEYLECVREAART